MHCCFVIVSTARELFIKKTLNPRTVQLIVMMIVMLRVVTGVMTFRVMMKVMTRVMNNHSKYDNK